MDILYYLQIFMKMMKKGDTMRKQEMYSYYMKFVSVKRCLLSQLLTLNFMPRKYHKSCFDNSFQSKNSADCQNVFGTSGTTSSTTNTNTGNRQTGAVWPFNDNPVSQPGSSGSSSVPFPFNVNVGAQASSSTSTGYDQFRSMVDSSSSAFSLGGGNSMSRIYPGSKFHFINCYSFVSNLVQLQV